MRQIHFLLGLFFLMAPSVALSGSGFGVSAPGTVDTSPPQIELLSPLAGDHYGPEVDIRWTITEDSPAAAADAVALWTVSATGALDLLQTYPLDPGLPYQFAWTPAGAVGHGTFWRVTAADAFGNHAAEDGSPFAISDAPGQDPIPPAPVLHRAWPNPFNPTTTLGFSIPADGKVTLAIYDPAGRLVATLRDGFMARGRHEATWQATTEASGIYFAMLRTAGTTTCKKLNLIK